MVIEYFNGFDGYKVTEIKFNDVLIGKIGFVVWGQRGKHDENSNVQIQYGAVNINPNSQFAKCWEEFMTNNFYKMFDIHGGFSVTLNNEEEAIDLL